MATIETSIFDTLIVVTFENTAINTIDSIICVDRDVLAEQLEYIEEQDHLTLICVANAAVARVAGAAPSFPVHELHALASPQLAPTTVKNC
jgi:predicted regulator of amino acid metabolism with ACT domain